MFSRHLAAILPVIAVMAPSSLQAETPSVAMVTAVNLNMRAGPDASSDVVVVVPQDGRITITEQDGPWFHGTYFVAGAPHEGWVHGNHIEIVQKAPATEQPSRLEPEPEPAPPPVPRQFINPMHVLATDFDCEEGLSTGGYDSCTVEISVHVDLPSAFVPYAANEVAVSCQSDIEYQEQGDFMSSSETEYRTGHVYLSSGFGSAIIYIEHSFAYSFKPIISARLERVSCKPSY